MRARVCVCTCYFIRPFPFGTHHTHFSSHMLNCHFGLAVNSQQGSLISRQSFTYFIGKNKTKQNKHNPGWMDDNIHLEMVIGLLSRNQIWGKLQERQQEYKN